MSETGIRQLGVSEARANMTEVIAEVRLLGQPVALTRRDKPQAMLISMDRWKAAVLDAEIRPIYDELVSDLRQALNDPEFASAFEKKLPRWREVFEGDGI
ncbi:type II toxin-antitoxin system Phd/YefM family antitoxin [Streptomyces naphthomycinicus]|uniref:type II toxin-antitoxin system Phd/YefM family antitoxin n=1 Tax=Streptomyces naphthomycinicus TaxID=2872625 RepID=UPI001CED05F5|nr:type II toxin-antitoxin system prevent-host-death family antitoxin [Streptomyces sp. TML10]